MTTDGGNQERAAGTETTSSRCPTPPPGHRLLREGEAIRAGDIYLRAGQWLHTNSTGGRWNPRGYWPMARKTEGRDG